MTRIVVRETLEEEFLKQVGESCPVDLGPLPAGALSIWRKGPCDIIVKQNPPAWYALDWRDEERQARIRVYLPWLQWWGMYRDKRLRAIACTATTTEVKQDSDPVRLPPLPNIYTDRNYMCLGNVTPVNNANLWLQLEDTIGKVMVSEWNRDLAPDWANLGLDEGRASRATTQAQQNAAIYLCTYGLGRLSILSNEQEGALYNMATDACPLLRRISSASQRTFKGLKDHFVDKLSRGDM